MITNDNTAPITITDAQVTEFFGQGPEAATLDVSETAEQPADSNEQTSQDSLPAAEPAAEPERQKTIDYDAFHNERKRRKEVEAETYQLREKLARMEGAFQTFLTQQRQTQQPQPDITQDPVSFFKSEIDRLQGELNKHAGYTQERMMREQEERMQARLVSDYRAAAQQFASQKPDFVDAYGAWTNSVVSELMDYGYDRQAAVERASALEMEIVAKALLDEVNPAERVYAAAKRRGWAGSAPQPKQSNLQAVANGQKALGMGTASAGTAKGSLTLEDLSGMSPQDMVREWDKIFG